MEKHNLRKLWEEEVKFDDSVIKDDEERESLEHCRDSNYKYFIHHVSGEIFTFSQFINKDNAVRYFFY